MTARSMIVPHGTTEPRPTLVLSSDAMLDQAYTWLCAQRLERRHNNSIWDLRYNWSYLKPQLQQQLRTGAYHLSPMQSHYINNEWISSWTALDSLVLKALTLTLQPLFSIKAYVHCTHLKDAGGLHAAIKQVSANQGNYHHILKSDAYHYDESIDHQVLLAALEQHVACPILLNLVSQYCQRLENHRVKLARRYAQGASVACVGDYVARWTSWCTGVLKCCSSKFDVINAMGQEASRQIGHVGLPKEDNHEKFDFEISMEERITCA